MKKLFAKLLTTAVIVAAFLFISAPVFASTGIHPSILHLVGMTFNLETPHLQEIIDDEKSKLVQENANIIDKYISNSTKKSVAKVEEYIQEEVNRIDLELINYRDELYIQLDQEMSFQEEDLKAVVDNYIDSKIQESKDELDVEIIDELVRHLQNELSN